MKCKLVPYLICCILLPGCFFNSNTQKVYGKYYLTPMHGAARGLGYEIADGGYLTRIKGDINAVQVMGDSILLVEQWSENTKQYFAIDMKRDRDIIEPAEIVLGPMDRQGFLRYYSNHFNKTPLALVAIKE